jgi:hypothetical protein
MVKKLWIIGALALLLCGCGAQETFETVEDVWAAPTQPAMQHILLDLPADANAPALQSDTGDKLYLCDGFSVTVHVLQAGDMEKTLRTVTGYEKEDLQTALSAGDRFHCVWTAAGEGQTQVGKTTVIDDGNYHYALTVMMPETAAGELQQQVQQIFNSFRLTQEPVGTGS